MSIQQCADLVYTSDPDRFRAVMSVPFEYRENLFVLYAFNLELTRAAWASSEPLISQMRLQWWHDTIEGEGGVDLIAQHEVAKPLLMLLEQKQLPKSALHDMIEARSADAFKQFFETQGDLQTYIENTSGQLMWLAGLCCGASEGDKMSLRALGVAQGCANWLSAYAQTHEQNWRACERLPADWALHLAQYGRAQCPAGALSQPVQMAGRAAWMAPPLLKAAIEHPNRVKRGVLMEGVRATQLRLLWAALRGRWS